jgi:hypothetical protein
MFIVVLYNMTKEDILIENFREYYESGLEDLKRGRFNSATTLFFKAIAALCDIYVLRKEGFVPSSHANRFRVLEEKHPEVYRLVDRDFPFYQDSYTKKMDEESAILLKEDAENLKRMLGI